MIDEFKMFIMRGNVLDLAVGVHPRPWQRRACRKATRCPSCTSDVEPVVDKETTKVRKRAKSA
jgi:hypothetical protein